ncbi:MAG TPA: hypothetical protein VG265_16595 [Gaiellaceae bacterium]|nr:hypothetical protein [Gaiellaceae bacterium]
MERVIQEFVDRFIAAQPALVERYATTKPESYAQIVKDVVELVRDESDDETPDPERIHEIDDGEYQGTLLFVIGASGYQPSTYWATHTYYGSCSGCDTLQSLDHDWGWEDEEPDLERRKQAAEGYGLIALHLVQRLTLVETTR